jgi:uncharacterized protein with FMN-binding domain
VRARAIWGSALAAFGVLAIGWGVGTAGAPTTTSTLPGSSGVSGSGTSGSSGSGGSTSGSTGGSTGGSTAGTPAAQDGSYTGAAESTPFGTVQVSVTVSGGRLSDVTALHLTDRGGQSVRISNRAAPILRQEVLAAQSAHVSMVGGATYTSEGYLASVQSALDQAGWR